MDNEVHIGRLVSILSNKIGRRISKDIAMYGVTGTQGRILGFIYHNSEKRDIFQRDIEEELNIRRSSVTSILKLMEKNGHIRRVSVSEDARLKKIIITEKGIDIQKNAYDCILKFEKEISDELSPEEKNFLTAILNRLSENIKD